MFSRKNKKDVVEKVSTPINTSTPKRKKADIIKETFENFSQVPKNAKIVSDNPESPFYIEEAELRKHILILEANYIPKGYKTPIDAVILILSRLYKPKININEMYSSVLKNGKRFVVDQKEKTFQFISEVKKDIDQRKELAGNDDEDTGMRLQVRELFEDVYMSGASDLHIEIREQTTVRCRINGEIKEFKEYRNGAILNRETGMSLARTIFNTFANVAGKSLNEKIPQDALIEIPNIFEQNIRVRLATAPSEPKGLDMVMRILAVQDSSKPLTLEQLGYQEKQRNVIREAVAQGVGVTIIAGTTGSGKSTTLQNILKGEINSRDGRLKVITVEDPPEYFIPGSTQIPVIRDEKGDAKTAFKNAIKASLRMDPDVLMIGEVRDEQSAELLIEAVQTGHKVLSTIHAGSALSIIGRLENLGIKKDVLSDNEFISGLIYQKLFPVLCPHCSLSLNEGHVPVKKTLERVILENDFIRKEELNKIKKTNKNINIVRLLQDLQKITLTQAEEIFEIYKKENNEEENEKLLKRISSIAGNLSDHDIRFKGEGCEQCKKGIKGRTVVSEVIRPDMELRELISEGKSTAIFKYWRKNLGGKTAKEDSYEKMLQGKLSPIDIEDTFGFIDSTDI